MKLFCLGSKSFLIPNNVSLSAKDDIRLLVDKLIVMFNNYNKLFTEIINSITQIPNESSLLSDSTGTIAINFNLFNSFYVTLSGIDRIVTFSNPREGMVCTFLIIQGSGGNKTITTWPTITWLDGGSAPTLSTTAAKADIVEIRYINGIYYGYFISA